MYTPTLCRRAVVPMLFLAKNEGRGCWGGGGGGFVNRSHCDQKNKQMGGGGGLAQRSQCYILYGIW